MTNTAQTAGDCRDMHIKFGNSGEASALKIKDVYSNASLQGLAKAKAAGILVMGSTLQGGKGSGLWGSFRAGDLRSSDLKLYESQVKSSRALSVGILPLYVVLQSCFSRMHTGY